MRRLLLCVAAAVGALVAAPTAPADGPLFVIQGGGGVASRGGGLNYVAVPDGAGGTLLESITHGQVRSWVRLDGSWGIPTVGTNFPSGEGLARDGRTLVLASTSGPYASPSKFLVVDAKRMKVLRTIVLRGRFSFDALSPDGSRLYLIQYAHGPSYDVAHYIVRDYDMRTSRLLPGRIVDRAEKDEKMTGYALTRTTSAGGRWVYTLYEKPSGEPFVHALDTVAATAHCIDLPANRGIYNVVLSLRNGGRTLAVHFRSGRPWLNVSVGNWEISYPGSGFPWAWVGAGGGGGLVILAAGALVLRRRRREEVQEHPREELGLA